MLFRTSERRGPYVLGCSSSRPSIPATLKLGRVLGVLGATLFGRVPNAFLLVPSSFGVAHTPRSRVFWCESIKNINWCLPCECTSSEGHCFVLFFFFFAAFSAVRFDTHRT